MSRAGVRADAGWRRDAADRGRKPIGSFHGRKEQEIDTYMPADYSTFLVLGKLSPADVWGLRIAHFSGILCCYVVWEEMCLYFRRSCCADRWLGLRSTVVSLN